MIIVVPGIDIREQLIIASCVLSALSTKETVTVNTRVSLNSVLLSPSLTE